MKATLESEKRRIDSAKTIAREVKPDLEKVKNINQKRIKSHNGLEEKDRKGKHKMPTQHTHNWLPCRRKSNIKGKDSNNSRKCCETKKDETYGLRRCVMFLHKLEHVIGTETWGSNTKNLFGSQAKI